MDSAGYLVDNLAYTDMRVVASICRCLVDEGTAAAQATVVTAEGSARAALSQKQLQQLFKRRSELSTRCHAACKLDAGSERQVCEVAERHLRLFEAATRNSESFLNGFDESELHRAIGNAQAHLGATHYGAALAAYERAVDLLRVFVGPHHILTAHALSEFCDFLEGAAADGTAAAGRGTSAGAASALARIA